MPDVPRDPRQLARDILSGKIRIEDLARERQLRGGGPPATGPRLPDKIPLPRPAAIPPPRPPQQRPMPQQSPRPMQRPIPPRPQQRPMPPPSPVRPQQRQTPRAAPPVMTSPAQRAIQLPPPLPALSPYALGGPADAAAKPVRRSVTLGALLRSKHALRHGVLLAEILGKPISLRDMP